MIIKTILFPSSHFVFWSLYKTPCLTIETKINDKIIIITNEEHGTPVPSIFSVDKRILTTITGICLRTVYVRLTKLNIRTQD